MRATKHATFSVRLYASIGLWFCFFFTCLSPRLSAMSWMEASVGVFSDDNVFSYVVPYEDNYSLLDFKINLKDKFSPTTHYVGNYSLRTAAYNRWLSKNYYHHNFGFNVEEDVIQDLAVSGSTQGTVYLYTDPSSAKYDYLLWTAAAGLRYFMFVLGFTNIDLGVRYQLYTLPNYDFSREGWTPSLTFLEEVAEYSSFAATLNVKQELLANWDLELSGAANTNYCPERPLYRSAHAGDFAGEHRQDAETSANAALVWRFAKNSNLRAGASLARTTSNANALTYDIGTGAVLLQEDYYNRQCLNLSVSGFYCFGAENSFLRCHAGMARRDYAERKAQDSIGAQLAGARSDREFNLLFELNQRLGQWLGTGWVLKTSYNYIQNQSNDYYYNYIREVFSIGVSSNLYL